MKVLSRERVRKSEGVWTLLLTSLLLTVFHSSLSAQSLSHPLSPWGGDFFFQTRVFPDTIRLLGIMVQFQQDTDSRTTGNGQFELFVGNPDSVIDAPPHDRAYFLNHLKFLENYYRRASDGKVIIQSEVLEPIITLSNKMQFYSPLEAGELRPLALLVEESWRKADSLHHGFDFSRYQCFVIFHAGVGRDINLQQIFGFDPTPFDIPSVYLNLSTLKNVFGSNYKGVPVSGGRTFVTNSMLIPESESRILPSLTGQTLLELSINGLLAASFGSFLGLPDLFDTKTGRSGIGRFGLMDGQAIFSFNGLFPPEPSAWEKIYLGWVTPTVVPPGSATLTARAVGFHDAQSAATYKVPINAKEYFLIENRNRDPNRNGQRVTSIVRGQVVERTFSRDTIGFNAADTRAIRGVVIDVEDYDWSLPGGVDPSGRFFDGGLLIWHIDENVIEANYASNTVNANPNHRGVDLEEADGSQDIGQAYDPFLHPGAGSESGTALDFWFKGNSSPVFKNAFTPSSNPNSLSNTSANSQIYLTDFSERAPTMTFKVQVGDNFLSPMSGFPKFLGMSGAIGAPVAQRAGCPLICNNFFFTVSEKIYGFRLDGTSITHDPSGLFDTRGGRFQPAIPYFGSPLLQFSNAVGASDSSVFVWNVEDRDKDGRGDLLFVRSIGRRISSPPVVFMTGARFSVMVGDVTGSVSIISQDSVKRIPISQRPIRAILNVGGQWIAVAEDRAQSEDGNAWDFSPKRALQAVGADLDGDGIAEIVVTTEDNRILLFNKTSSRVSTLFVPFQSGALSLPAVGDVDGDGRKEILVSAGNKIFALNIAGNPVDRFPIELPSHVGVATMPVLAKVGDSKTLSLFVGTSSGLIFGYDSQGRLLRGFPISAGGSITSPLALFEETDFLGILAATDDGHLYAWSLPEKSKSIVWGNTFRDPLHTGFESSPSTGKPIANEFLPSDRAYNWPNPVYGRSTRIRYFLNADAVVTVKVFDLAGSKVAEFSAPGTGGIDNEVDWDVSDIQSGLYLARIEANSPQERSVALVKIAVVK